ncbi:MAG: energy-coupling factor transporter transmembrane component T family protein [Candidatus Methanofastidiosia archaeon]
MNRYTLYLRRDSFIHSLDPRTKLFLSTAVFLISLTFKDFMILGLLFLSELIIISIFAKISVKKIFVFLKPVVPLLLMAMLLWPFFDKTGFLLFRFWIFGVYSGGIKTGLSMGFRILSMITASYILLFTTEQRDLVLAMVRLGLRYEYGLTLSIALRYVPTLAGIALTIVDAQKARALELERGNFLQRIKKYVPILTPLIVYAIKMSQELAIAIESKAFGYGERTYFKTIKFRKRDWLCCLLASLLLSGALILRFYLGVGG